MSLDTYWCGSCGAIMPLSRAAGHACKSLDNSDARTNFILFHFDSIASKELKFEPHPSDVWDNRRKSK